MHHYLIPLSLLLVLAFLVMPSNRSRRPRPYFGNDDRTLPPRPIGPIAAKTEAKTPQRPAENPQSKLSQDENVQLKQALALSQDVKNLEADFAAIRSRLPSVAPAGDAKAATTSREVAIATEQLRIARSYSNELMRFAMAPYLSPTLGQSVPSFSDASWAFTAGQLTLSFARARIASLC